MRVLHLVKTSIGATWALRQVRALVEFGVRANVALPPGPMVERYAAAGAEVHEFQADLPLRRPWLIPEHLRRLRALIEDVRPEVIHSHFVGTTLAVRLALGNSVRVPRVFQVPGPLHLEHAGTRELEYRTGGDLDLWVGSCSWTCERYRALGVPPERVFLSYYCPDPPPDVTPEHRDTLRSLTGIGRDTRIVGMVAYMYAPKRYLGQRRGLKGHEDLIDAVASLRARGRRVAAVFVGGAWNGATAYEESIKRRARKRLGGAAVFLGTRSDVAKLYAGMDVAVHPSHSENLGGAAESMTLGVPTVATRVGGFPDLVRNGETGWLVPPRDPERLAEAIDSVLSDPAGAVETAARGRDHARRLLDLQRNTEVVLSAYRAALELHRRPGSARSGRRSV